MRLAVFQPEVRQTMQLEGVFDATYKYKVSGAECAFNYTGPKFSREMWYQIMAFCKDTFDRIQSECQVRLYVNPTEGVWRAWAFPQECPGMTTKEVADRSTWTEAQRAQRAAFGDDWLYFGTVHHHCSTSAFQSGTDKENEVPQDGIHITLGLVDKPMWDIHVRFYHKRCQFDVDMSLFWDISESLAGTPPNVVDMLTDDIRDRIARHEMCQPPPAGATFPPEWAANIVKITYVGTGQWNGGVQNGSPKYGGAANSGERYAYTNPGCRPCFWEMMTTIDWASYGVDLGIMEYIQPLSNSTVTMPWPGDNALRRQLNSAVSMLMAKHRVGWSELRDWAKENGFDNRNWHKQGYVFDPKLNTCTWLK